MSETRIVLGIVHRSDRSRRVRSHELHYERWIHSIAQTLIQRGVINIEELGRKMAEAGKAAC